MSKPIIHNNNGGTNTDLPACAGLKIIKGRILHKHHGITKGLRTTCKP